MFGQGMPLAMFALCLTSVVYALHVVCILDIISFMISCFYSMRLRGYLELFQPDQVTYTSLLSAYGKAGSTDKAGRVLERMQRGSIQPDQVTYNSLFGAYCYLGDAE